MTFTLFVLTMNLCGCLITVYWADGEDDFYDRADYSNLLPSQPRIIDPANPSNNVWETGFIPNGNSSVLVSKIDTIDLSRPIDC